MENILEIFDRRVKEQGQKEILVLSEKRYTYAGFNELVNSIVDQICTTGYKRGDRIVTLIDYFDYFYASILAIWKIGAVAVPLNVSLKNEDLQKLIVQSSSSLVMYMDEKYSGLEAKEKLVLKTDSVGDFGESLTKFEPLKNDEIAAIMFTSGTTGIPKGVVQRLYTQSRNAFLTCGALGLTDSDRVFINTPPYFTSGLSHFITLIYAGGGLSGYSGFVFGKDILAMMKDTGSTGFGGAPAHLIRVVETMDEEYTDSQINFWMSSGDSLPMDAIEKTWKMLPNVRLFNVYGLTEVSGRLCILDPKYAKEKHGSVGIPIGEMKVTVTDENECPVSDGTLGQINVGGELLFKEYLEMPEITAKAKGEFGFRTGDFGYKDKDGFVFIEGRKDDIFKRGGEKVSTNKIKQKMLELNIFKDVAVVAMDDALMGKTPVAVVVMKDDVKFSKFKILKGLKNNLVATHIPSNILNVESIPRTGSGKAKIGMIKELISNKA